jgi:hypothetical protein
LIFFFRPVSRRRPCGNFINILRAVFGYYFCAKKLQSQTLLIQKRKQWSSGRALDSLSEGHGFDPRPMLDGRGVKAMPDCQDQFLHPILVHYRKIRKNR